MLLLLYALDHPFHDGVGGLRPVAMERTLRVVDEELDVLGDRRVTPCDEARERALGRSDLADLARRRGPSSVALARARRSPSRPARAASSSALVPAGSSERRPRHRRAADAGPRRHVRRAHRDHAVERGRLPEVGPGHRQPGGRRGVPPGLGGDQPAGAPPTRSTTRCSTTSGRPAPTSGTVTRRDGRRRGDGGRPRPAGAGRARPRRRAPSSARRLSTELLASIDAVTGAAAPASRRPTARFRRSTSSRSWPAAWR